MIRPMLSSLAAAALLALMPTGALAKTVTLDLTGTVANATTNGPFTVGGRTYIQGSLVLDGMIPFDLEAGDIINASILLDAPYIIPPSGEQLFAFSLFNTGADNGQPTSNFADLTFSNSVGPTGLPSNMLAGACSNCLATITAGPGTPFSFDSLIVRMTVGQITPNLFTINGASVNYQLSSAIAAVPEPATWAMLILGFGTIGALMRRRRAVPTLAMLPA